MNKIITISREFGSGGRTIGKLLAERLHIPRYDEELIDMIASESGFAKEFISERSEDAPFSGWLSNAFSDRGFDGLSSQDYLWNIQRDIILEIAQKDDCVIIGRCAEYILKDRADLLKVFIYADIDKRTERIVKLYGERDISSKKRLKDKDKRRAAFYHIYTNIEWGKTQNYDLSLNSGTLGINQCVDILANLYENR